MFSLTLDNAAANEVAVKDVIKVFMKKSPLVCDGLFFHVRCANHILNLIARDGLKQIGDAIWGIRTFVLAVKCSPPQWEDFIKCAEECGLSTTRGLSLDVQTRWNSTYLMLKDAIYYKDAFDRLYETDKKRYAGVNPSDEDWDQAQILCKCLKRFNDITELLSGTLYPTANLFYQSFCEIKALISEWCSSANDTIKRMTDSMNTTFEKYWKKSNIALVVAFFLDPRYKKKAIEFYMRKIYGPLLYHGKVEEFIVVVKQMYQAYASIPKGATGHGSANGVDPKRCDIMEEDDDEDFQNYLHETHGLVDEGETSDLEKYMAEPPLRGPKTGSNKFDVLSWWKSHQEVYPILSVLARDALAIQASTVPSESAFSAGGRVIDPFRSRLEPEMVEALICTKYWVAASRKDDKKGVGSILNDLEVAETLIANLTLEDLEDKV
ncbi:Zinc finger BED domain-containing protein DAYSLEEPER [Striga hermonthica]|uniref:Zinc finger BED domain-containing protein DAYSLEEPER n=1 Tax=Striga hermonthica TaxID=68872 RepID=A0A9N7RHF0_STRHE|nr:Zinc finger BED domain-containing protein DAYSLEEPER [Striga hermonthica]